MKSFLRIVASTILLPLLVSVALAVPGPGMWEEEARAYHNYMIHLLWAAGLLLFVLAFIPLIWRFFRKKIKGASKWTRVLLDLFTTILIGAGFAFYAWKLPSDLSRPFILFLSPLVSIPFIWIIFQERIKQSSKRMRVFWDSMAALFLGATFFFLLVVFAIFARPNLFISTVPLSITITRWLPAVMLYASSCVYFYDYFTLTNTAERNLFIAYILCVYLVTAFILGNSFAGAFFFHIFGKLFIER